MSTISFSIAIPDTLLINRGDRVDFQTPLSKRFEATYEYMQVAKDLGISPESIFMHLIKVVGENIKRGDSIAEKKTFLGKKSVHSDFEGTVHEVNHQEGIVTIQTLQETGSILHSFFMGEIEGVDGTQISLKVKSSQSFDLEFAGCDFGGELLIASSAKNLSQLTTDDVSQKVIVIKEISNADAVRLDVLDEAGLILPAENKQEYDSLKNYAKLKNKKDWDSVVTSKMPYALVDSTNNKLYLYDQDTKSDE